MTGKQKILVFQQNKSGEPKIQGIKKFGDDLFILETISIDAPMPIFLDDTKGYLPNDIQADLVLDFLKHPDLSYDLAKMCLHEHIPMVASGKKYQVQGTLTPPT